jgi:hypothetical protein
MKIMRGDRVFIKPEWQDAGDDKLTWVAVEDSDGGRVTITPIDSRLAIKPQYRVDVSMLHDTRECAGWIDDKYATGGR